jgi:hypothetical protein
MEFSNTRKKRRTQRKSPPNRTNKGAYCTLQVPVCTQCVSAPALSNALT